MKRITLVVGLVLAVLSLFAVPLEAGGRFLRGRSSCSTGFCAPVVANTYVAPVYAASTYVAPAPAYVAPAVPTYTSDWKTRVVEYAKAKDDQLAFFGALKAIGVNGNVYDYGYGSYYKNYAASSTPVQGDTVYGYTYNQIQAAYGQTDLNTLYQQASRLTQGAQTLASDANNGFQSLVQTAGDNQARIAEYFVNAQAQALLLQASKKAVEPQPQTITQTTIQGGGSTIGQGGAVIQAQPAGNDNGWMRTVAKPLCASCHTGSNAAGKFDIDQYPLLTQEQKAVVWERLTTRDDGKRMPRDGKDKSKPGQPLTAPQLAEFFRH